MKRCIISLIVFILEHLFLKPTQVLCNENKTKKCPNFQSIYMKHQDPKVTYMTFISHAYHSCIAFLPFCLLITLQIDLYVLHVRTERQIIHLNFYKTSVDINHATNLSHQLKNGTPNDRMQYFSSSIKRDHYKTNCSHS